MALGEKIRETVKDIVFDVADVLSTPLRWGLEWGLEGILDLLGRRFAPQLRPLIETLEKTGKVPPELQPLLNEMKEPSGEVAALLQFSAARGGLGAVSGGILSTITASLDQAIKAALQPSLVDVGSLITAERRKSASDGWLNQEWLWSGFSGARRDVLRDVTKPLVDISTLTELYHRFPNLRDYVDDVLEKYGFSEADRTSLRLAWEVLPGVQDIIRMAVREAFSPEIVAKFGMDSDFPPEFGERAERRGLSAENAKNYWRAHWDLPSATQGFEMFHRNVISYDELNTLLRTLDVMPFWRDRLIQMTYSLPTRVDIRRIYNLGIRDRDWVKQQYLKLGYSEDDAEALTEFTTTLATSTDRDLTKADILSLYKKGVLDEATATEYLIEIGYSEDDADYLIAKEATAVAEATRELSLTQIKSLALSGIIDKTEATARMADIGYTAEDIEKLYSLWTLDAPLQNALPSRTDLKNFYQAGIIDIDTWIDYMWKLRYPEEVIAWYYQQMISA